MFFSGFGADDENELPGSSDWFKLDGEVGLGRANKRADLVKVESLLANSGDLDLSEIGGPTGYGLYTVEDGVKKYQSRNGLDVDGWMKPGGPTISKMKEQLGGILGGYPAPTPE
jgi:peptidoglycan hydrolase-like protein with peptidoglycan-binding domain